MAVHAGRHPLGMERGRIMLRTFRDGLASQAGHDLTIEITQWSGQLMVGDDLAMAELTVRIDLSSLVVRDGTGGLKPLTDRDRREIAVTARKVLGTERHPEATFTSSAFAPDPAGGGVLTGALTIAGVQRPQSLQVSETGQDSYHATTAIKQSAFGVKPYTAFLGALKVRDAVDVYIDLDLSGQGQPGAGS